jgi:uncharacterized protein
MVDVTPLIRSDFQVIQSYRDGHFKVSDQIYDHPVIVYPTKTEPWDPPGYDKLSADHFNPILATDLGVEIVLLGTGKTMQPPKRKMIQQLSNDGLSLDTMDTGAACRTFNVLIAEDRKVAAAMYLFD